MSMNATDDVVSSSATFLATVDFPEPLPPAIPIMSGLSTLLKSYDDGRWNALCRPVILLKSLFVSWLCNEKNINCARVVLPDSRCLPHDGAGLGNPRSESSHRGPGR